MYLGVEVDAAPGTAAAQGCGGGIISREVLSHPVYLRDREMRNAPVHVQHESWAQPRIKLDQF